MSGNSWRRITVALMIVLSVGIAGCQQTPEPPPEPTEVVLPPPPTEAATEPAVAGTATTVATELPPTATIGAEEPTAEAPTPTPEASATAVESPTPAASPTAADTPTPQPSPTPAVLVLAPGQSNAAPLTEGGYNVYGYDGVEFQPAMVFVEPADTLDVALAAYLGDVVPGSDLSTLAPLNEADFSTAGGPEIVVITPEEDGRYSLVVRSDGGAGGYTAYLYDGISDAPGTAVRQADTLAAGQTKTYAVQSNGARPVLVFVDPTDRSNVVVRVTDSNGNLAADANFSGLGSAEALFVLPLQTTTYTVQVSEATGAASSYNVVVVTLE